MSPLALALCIIGAFLTGFALGLLYADRIWRNYLGGQEPQKPDDSTSKG